jgi:Predicted membrane protein
MTTYYSSWSPRVLSIVRIVSGYLFFLHGLAKISGAHFQLMSLMGLATAIELVAGALIILGLFTRIAAFFASGEMAVAYFIAHAAKGAVLMPIRNGGDAAVLFCFVFLYLVFAGPGPWSIDQLRRKA